MSRVGKALINMPAGVTVSLRDGAIAVKGPLGELQSPLPAGISLEQKDGALELRRANDERELRALHGTARALLQNTVLGVSKGWEKRLELIGVGYRAQLKGKELVFSLGYSHEVRYALPAAVAATVTDQTKIDLKSIDKQKLGQVASEIRALRPPEPYKGKGVKYADETIRRKAGKAGKAGKK
ncbi:MAG: 50S ribosomal protein L6 [Leptospirales bacterium]|nr:50S ribosomal protein L6 [Leptospirales bacterium]